MRSRIFFLLAMVVAGSLLMRLASENKRPKNLNNGFQADTGNARETVNHVADGVTKDDGVPEEIVRIEAELREALPDFENPIQLRWLAENYGNTAVNIAREHGQTGIEVIVTLGSQGIAVMREHPDTFEKVAQQIGGETAAVFLVHLHQHFEEIAAFGGLPGLLARIESLPPEMRELGMKYPEMLVFLACAPAETYKPLREYPDLCLLIFTSIDLSEGPEPLERMGRIITLLGTQAEPWVKDRGLDGLLLADTFPTLLEWDIPLELPVFLGILSHNQQDIQKMIAEGHEADVRRAFMRLVDEDCQLPFAVDEQQEAIRQPQRGDWIKLASLDHHTIRFLVEKENAAYDVLKRTFHNASQTGDSLPSLLYDAYTATDLPNLHAHAWDSLTVDGEECEAFQMLHKMAAWPDQDPRTIHSRSRRFRQLLAKHDARVVAYLAEAELFEGSTESRYRLLEERGESHLDSWAVPESWLVESIPLYETARLGRLVAEGNVPTQGEVVFAGIDVAFTAWDIATFGAGKAASVAIKGGMKVAGEGAAQQASKRIATSIVRNSGRRVGDDAVEGVSRALLNRMSRSPEVAMEIAAKRTYRNLAVNAEIAAWSAKIKRIPISKLVKYTMREWTINAGVDRSLTALAEQSSRSDNTFWALKVKEALLAIDKFSHAPIVD